MTSLSERERLLDEATKTAARLVSRRWRWRVEADAWLCWFRSYDANRIWVAAMIRNEFRRLSAEASAGGKG